MISCLPVYNYAMFFFVAFSFRFSLFFLENTKRYIICRIIPRNFVEKKLLIMYFVHLNAF